MKRSFAFWGLLAALMVAWFAGFSVSAYAQTGAWVMERIGYQDDRQEPNHSFSLTNPEQAGGRGNLEASVFYAQRSKFKVGFSWSDPPDKIAPGANIQITLSLALVENKNLGNYSLLGTAAAAIVGNYYPERTCCASGRNFQDSKGNYQAGVYVSNSPGTKSTLLVEAKAPGDPGQAGEKWNIRVSLTNVGFNPRYYYIYHWQPDGKPVNVIVDKGAEQSGVIIKPQPNPKNLALGKPTRMSSQYPGPYPASNGVDGNSGSMFHTNIENNPWWQVDLQSSFALSSIVLHNRFESNGDRARTIQVLISQDGNAWTTIYRHNGTVFKDLTVDAGGKIARYVRVQLAETNYLHLLEVEVFGSAIGTVQTDPVLGKPVEEFNNYNSNVACSFTDKATFSLRESIHQAQAALWYDFGNGTQSVAYTLTSPGQLVSRGSVKKGDCAAGYTWCHGFIDLGDLGPGTYAMVTAPARICHNPDHDGGNGFIRITGVPKN